MEETSITIYGLRIDEPVTVLTDFLVSFVCFYCFSRLMKEKKKEAFYLLYCYFLLIMGFSTLYGGLIGHGFAYAFSSGWSLPAWILSMLAVGLAERAAIIRARPLMKNNLGNFISIANLFEVFIMIFLTIYTLNFFIVELHATYGLLLIVASFEIFVLIKTGERKISFILWGVIGSTLAATIHLTQFTIHQWFNYLDLAHVVMAISVVLFYNGIKKSSQPQSENIHHKNDLKFQENMKIEGAYY